MKKKLTGITPEKAAREITARLKAMRNERNIAGMRRFGICSANSLGVPMPVVRGMAKEYGRSQELAELLWEGGLHEGRTLACLVGEPERLSVETAERWAIDLDSWAACDNFCLNLLAYTPFAWNKAREWAARDKEYVKRAAFSVMAALAVHDKAARDRDFEKLLPLIRAGARDERNFVKKAVNWALRQIGKRNMKLNGKALALARELAEADSPHARWVGKDAVRELENRKTIEFIKCHREGPIA